LNYNASLKAIKDYVLPLKDSYMYPSIEVLTVVECISPERNIGVTLANLRRNNYAVTYSVTAGWIAGHGVPESEWELFLVQWFETPVLANIEHLKPEEIGDMSITEMQDLIDKKLVP